MSMDNQERLHRYFDGELTAEERARFEAEMTDDDRDRIAALAEMRAVITGTLEAEASDVDLWPALAKQLTPAPRGRRLRDYVGPRSVGGAFALAAAAALALFLMPREATANDVEVEMLDVAGGTATVMKTHDHPDSEAGTTVIWLEED